ncbi:MAG: 1-deoxy-D-xylulose-5-phosphate synthase [Oscillospiraceae bacterium]|nr:1-deoxy-D-xylulose-5-phosphate synthase [Oscillospiraceae bacterium]
MLNEINSPADVKALDGSRLPELCARLRAYLVSNVAKTGGHLASNLGVVELTVAIHRVFDTSRDRLVFDVGHQCYIHKLLTGRKERFATLRALNGLAGFPKPSESRHDAFTAGHASNSISVGLGMARARTLSGQNYSVVSVIGDGALTGGLAYEALEDAGESGEPFIIILNDNGMSINGNVGGIAKYLSRQRLKPSYAAFKRRYRRIMEIVPGGRKIYAFTHGVKSAIKEALLHCSMFEELGLQYFGPINGHDITRLTEALEWARGLTEPVLIHVITQKGKGYAYSERTPDKYHGVPPFDESSGFICGAGDTFSSVFGEELVELAKKDARVCAITASMTEGAGLADFAARYPDRFFDVGITEGHAVSMAAGLACAGLVPVFAVYSTFLQRSYDMLLHDVCILGLHVVLCVDRAGLVAGDGETHQGVFDAAFLSTAPGMTVLCPAGFGELRDMLRYAISELDGPVAIRYPRGAPGAYDGGGTDASQIVREGADITIVTYGVMVNVASDAAELLHSTDISAEIVKLGRINPLDCGDIISSVDKTGRLLVLEDSAAPYCVGERIAAALAVAGHAPGSVTLLNAGGGSIPCGSLDELRALCGLDAVSVARAAREAVGV